MPDKRVIVRGKKDGRLQQLKIEVVDKYDTQTHFMAMERVTGWHAAIMLEMVRQVNGSINRL